MPKQDTSGKKPKPGTLGALGNDDPAGEMPYMAPAPTVGMGGINSSGDIITPADQRRALGQGMLALATRGRSLGDKPRRKAVTPKMAGRMAK